jgi:hypothetical protein
MGNSLVEKNPLGPFLIGMKLVLCLEIDPLLLSLLVIDSRKFVEDGSLIYTAWIVQGFHLFFLNKTRGYYIFSN